MHVILICSTLPSLCVNATHWGYYLHNRRRPSESPVSRQFFLGSSWEEYPASWLPFLRNKTTFIVFLFPKKIIWIKSKREEICKRDTCACCSLCNLLLELLNCKMEFLYRLLKRPLTFHYRSRESSLHDDLFKSSSKQINNLPFSCSTTWFKWDSGWIFWLHNLVHVEIWCAAKRYQHVWKYNIWLLRLKRLSLLIFKTSDSVVTITAKPKFTWLM